MLTTDTESSSLDSAFPTTFTWDYDRARAGLDKLYEKAKANQWNASTDLDWTIDVDPEKDVVEGAEAMGLPVGWQARRLADIDGSPIASWGDDEFLRFALENQKASMSQFLHGEQGALLCTSRLVESVPWIDAKYYASTQVIDEARHVEVFARYSHEKLGGTYPINPDLNRLLSEVITDDRWDIVYLGMQVVIEGLALSAFGMMRHSTKEPLLSDLLRYVMADEARHVAFGILSLEEFYAGLSAAEIKERQEFCYAAVDHMRRRTINEEMWEALGVDTKWLMETVLAMPVQRELQGLLFSKIVPNCKKLGLLDAGDGWLRDKFTEINIIRFEDAPAGDELLEMPEIAV
ncbi:MAG: ferritin-like domain-containing protein [Actinobacteria bacterium]|nr:ferritin-like domain-containing protein [Actinomycetota bacterium]NIS34539.1 ferritin-like domain-containing protein [Actinomycetota bacterium]NIT97563.1 ferritin-like domain-containing protein [Actinomycetota bacterium]NIU21221.1 ferritin-like domain-containing protein [Actinomycetota bacterium]NIU69306.1 ferritin-like domain-containing protein [Actinomycetota bacterium]